MSGLTSRAESLLEAVVAVVRVSGPSDLLAVVPFVLGYHPLESVVVLGLSAAPGGTGAGGGTSAGGGAGARRVGVVLRSDLPGPGVGVGDVAVELVRSLLGAEVSGGVLVSVVLVCYETVTGSSAGAADAVAGLLGSAGVEVADSLVVRGGRWWSRACSGSGCCPVEGSVLGEPVAAAEFVAAGLAPLPSRAALAARFLPVAQAAAVGRECDRLADLDLAGSGSSGLGPLVGLGVWGRVLGVVGGDGEVCGAGLVEPVAGLGDAALAVGAVATRDAAVRDALVAWLAPGWVPLDLVDAGLLGAVQRALPVPWRPAGPAPGAGAAGGRAAVSAEAAQVEHRAQDRLVSWCAVLPDEHAAPVLCVLAVFAWWRGDGGTARLAVQRARSAEPGYRLAALVEQMVDLGIRPT